MQELAASVSHKDYLNSKKWENAAWVERSETRDHLAVIPARAGIQAFSCHFERSEKSFPEYRITQTPICIGHPTHFPAVIPAEAGIQSLWRVIPALSPVSFRPNGDLSSPPERWQTTITPSELSSQP